MLTMIEATQALSTLLAPLQKRNFEPLLVEENKNFTPSSVFRQPKAFCLGTHPSVRDKKCSNAQAPL